MVEVEVDEGEEETMPDEAISIHLLNTIHKLAVTMLQVDMALLLQ